MDTKTAGIRNKVLIGGIAICIICIIWSSLSSLLYPLALPFALLVLIWMIIDFKSLYFCFVLCIPLSVPLDLGFFNTTLPDEQLMWAFLLIGPAFALITPGAVPRYFWKSPLTLILIIQFFWLGIAVLFSQNIALSAKFMTVKLWQLNAFVFMPIMIVRELKDIKKVLLCYGLPILFLSLWIFYLHYLTHFGFLDSNTVVAPFFVNHVDHAAILSMVWPMILAGFLLTRNLYYKVILGFFAVFFVVAIYFTYARGAMLAAIFAVVYITAIHLKIGNLIFPLIFSFMTGMVSWLSHNNTYLQFRPDYTHTYTRKNFQDLMMATVKGHDMSSMERFHRWIACIRMSTARPVTGVGPNNFYDYYKPFTVNNFQTYTSRNPEHSTTHNYFLYMLVEQGWPAMLLYALLLVTFTAIGQKSYNKARNRTDKILMAMTMMIFAASFINNFFSELLETHKVGALFYLSIVLMIILSHRIQNNAASDLKS